MLKQSIERLIRSFGAVDIPVRAGVLINALVIFVLVWLVHRITRRVVRLPRARLARPLAGLGASRNFL